MIRCGVRFDLLWCEIRCGVRFAFGLRFVLISSAKICAGDRGARGSGEGGRCAFGGSGGEFWMGGLIVGGGYASCGMGGLSEGLKVEGHRFRVTTQGPSNPQSKVIFGRFHQLLAINAHEMAPKPSPNPKTVLEVPWDTPTKGLLWPRNEAGRTVHVSFVTARQGRWSGRIRARLSE